MLAASRSQPRQLHLGRIGSRIRTASSASLSAVCAISAAAIAARCMLSCLAGSHPPCHEPLLQEPEPRRAVIGQSMAAAASQLPRGVTFTFRSHLGSGRSCKSRHHSRCHVHLPQSSGQSLQEPPCSLVSRSPSAVIMASLLQELPCSRCQFTFRSHPVAAAASSRLAGSSSPPQLWAVAAASMAAAARAAVFAASRSPSASIWPACSHQELPGEPIIASAKAASASAFA